MSRFVFAIATKNCILLNIVISIRAECIRDGEGGRKSAVEIMANALLIVCANVLLRCAFYFHGKRNKRH